MWKPLVHTNKHVVKNWPLSQFIDTFQVYMKGAWNDRRITVKSSDCTLRHEKANSKTRNKGKFWDDIYCISKTEQKIRCIPSLRATYSSYSEVNGFLCYNGKHSTWKIMNANKSTHRSWSCFLFLWRRLAEMVLYVCLMSFSILTSSVDKGTFFNIYINIHILKKNLHWHKSHLCKNVFQNEP